MTECGLRPQGPPAPGNPDRFTWTPEDRVPVTPWGGDGDAVPPLLGPRALTDGHVTLPSRAHDAVPARAQMERADRADASSPGVSLRARDVNAGALR